MSVCRVASVMLEKIHVGRQEGNSGVEMFIYAELGKALLLSGYMRP